MSRALPHPSKCQALAPCYGVYAQKLFNRWFRHGSHLKTQPPHEGAPTPIYCMTPTAVPQACYAPPDAGTSRPLGQFGLTTQLERHAVFAKCTVWTTHRSQSFPHMCLQGTARVTTLAWNMIARGAGIKPRAHVQTMTIGRRTRFPDQLHVATQFP